MRRILVLLAAAACSGDDGGGTPTTTTLCEGAGDPVLELGAGGLDDFAAWPDGTTVQIEPNGDRFGFWAALLTEGIDTTADATVFLRYSLGDDPETTDAGLTLRLQCPTEGPGWYEVFAYLDGDAAAMAALDGVALHLTGTITDAGGDGATDAVEAVLAAP